MKRMVLVVVVVGLVVVAALPPLFGARARSLIEDELAAIGEAPAPYASVEVTFDDWDVGWFSSTADASIAVALNRESGLPIRDDQPSRFDTRMPEAVTLYHGPFLVGVSPGLGWGSIEFVVDSSVIPELREFHESTGVDRIARLGVSVGFGSTTIGMDMPAFLYAASGLGYDEEIEFGGLEMHAVFRDAGERLEFDGKVSAFGITVTVPASWSADMVQMRWESSARKDSRIAELWLGEGQFDLGHVMIVDRGESLFEVNDIHVEGGTKIDGDVFIATNLYEVRDAVITNSRLDELVAEVSMGYGVDTLRRLMDAAYDLDAMRPQAQTELVNALIRERFNFDIDRLGFKHEDRAFLASLAIEFRGDELPDNFDIDVASEYPALLSFVSANLEMAFHKELLSGLGIDQMDSIMGVFAEMGIVRESGDDHTLNVGFERGVVSVNGEPLEPHELLELIGSL